MSAVGASAGFADRLSPPSAMPSGRDLGLWGTAALVVLAAHGAVAFYLTALQPEQRMPAAVEQSMEIELAPLEISTPDAVQSEGLAAETPTETVEPVEEVTELAEALPEEATPVAPTEQALTPALEELTETPPPEEIVPDAVETVQPEDTVTETAEAPEPEEVIPVEPIEQVAEAPPVEEVPPETPETLVAEEVFPATPDVAVPLPAPRPEPQRQVAEERPRTERPRREPPPERRVTRRQPQAEARQRPAARSEASQAQRAARAPTVNPARWQAQVQRRINRFKRTPRGASGSGTVQVRFSINASGSITSARVARSSGDPVLDEAAVSIVQRASPVPAPPEGISARTITVPIRFNL